MRLRIRAQAPMAEVHAALTDPGALRTWFAEHADVQPPDRYAFWGRYTPDGTEAAQRLLHLDDRSLRFEWVIEGVATTVEIGLTEEASNSTILDLSQTNLPAFDVILAQRSALAAVHTFWALAMANLIDYLEGRELTSRVDFASPTMHERIHIGASPQEVFRSFVDPEVFSQWFGAKMELEPWVGGRWSMGGFDQDDSPARIVDLEPDQRITIRFEDGLVYTWEVAGAEDGTWLTVMQSGFDDSLPPYDSWMGWLSGVAELRRYLEMPDWQPTWLEVYLEGMPEGLLTITDDTTSRKGE
jgi:uncharacterized protein YndB with AHSA1/START domain